MALFNVGCSVSGCTEPVVGQCQGYRQKACGKFYCIRHSQYNLCTDCASRKSADLLLADYTRTAENVKKYAAKDAWKSKAGHTTKLSILACGVIVSMSAFLGARPDQLWGTLWVIALSIAGFTLLAAAIAWRNQCHQSELMRAAAIATFKPNFETFFRDWKARKQKEQLMNVLVIGGALLAAGAAAAVASSDKSREDERLRNAVDDELNRRGIS